MFLWTKDNRTHIEERHQVTVAEVEAVFYNNPLLRVSNSQRMNPNVILRLDRQTRDDI